MNKKGKFAAGIVLGLALSFSFFNLSSLSSTYSPESVAAASCDSRTVTGYVDTEGKDTEARFRYSDNYSDVDSGSGNVTSTRLVPANEDQNIEATLTNLSPNTTYYYQMEAKWTTQSNWTGGSIHNFATPDCGGGTPAVKPTVNFYANPTSMTWPDQYTDLSWNVTGADVCWASSSTTPRWWNSNNPVNGPQGGTQPIPDLIKGNNGNNYFSLRCENSAGSTTKDVTVTVKEPVAPKDVLPKGYLDFASCSEINGWAFGTNYATIDVEITDGINSVTARADKNRQDVGNEFPDAGDWHGFKISTPEVFRNFSSTQIHAYALDISGSRVHLGTSPKTIPACKTTPPPVDVCPNIPGNQTSVPPGKHIDNYGNCVDDVNPPVDVCPNIGGIQTSVPPGMYIDNNGNCVNNPVSPSGNLTISPQSCVIAANESTCTTGATWTTTNATSPRVVDRNTGTTLSTAANRSTPFTVWVAYPQTIFDLRNGSTNLDTEVTTASCAQNTTWNGSICQQNNPQLPSVSLSANPTLIDAGNSSILTLTSNNVSSCNATSSPSNSQWTGGKNINDTFTYTITNITANTNFSISCVGTNGQQVNASAQVNLRTSGQLPTVTLRADDTSIDEGDETELTWTSTNADYCSRTGGRNGWEDNRVNTSGDFDTGDLTRDTTYRIQCFNNFGSASDSETVRVDDDDDDRVCTDRNATNYGSRGSCRYPNPVCQDSSALNYRGTLPCRYVTPNEQRPTVILYADQTSLPYNGTTFVRWSTVNATSCQASSGSAGWAGTKSIGSGSFYTGSLSSSRTYTLTCYNSSGSDTDSVTISVRQPTTGGPTPPPASSLVLVTSSIDRNQPILPTLDNTRPRPGDEITYTVNYQNIGTGAIRNLVLRLDLPYEVMYLYSTPANPMMAGNTLIFNLGTLPANGSGTVTVRVRVRQEAMPGALLNFPAVLSYTDPAGYPQTVTANVSAQVWNMQPEIIEANNANLLGAAAFLSGGFWPTTLFGWLLLIILILLLVLLARYLMTGAQPFERRPVTTTIQH